MIRRLTLLLWLLILSACSFFSSEPESRSTLRGWRTTGLAPNADERGDSGAGLQRVTHVGNRLFAMDAKQISRLEKRFQMFTTLQGDTTWDTLSTPGNVPVYTWFADSNLLYVGAERSGQVWSYDPFAEAWEDLNTGMDTVFRVYGISKFQGKLVVSFASYTDTTRMPLLLRENDGKWIDLHATKQMLFTAFHTMVEHNGLLVGATWEYGIWSWNPADSQWRQMPMPIGIIGEEKRFPRDLEILNGELYVCYKNGGGIQKYSNDGTWIRVDSAINNNGNILQTTPFDTYTLTQWNGRLFAAGYYSSNPTVYTAPQEPKGWRKIGRDTYCPQGAWACLGTDVGDLTVVNDTLYAAAWEAILKFPLVELDSAIKDAPPYPVP